MTTFNGPRCAALMRANMDALRIAQLGHQLGDLLDDLVNTGDLDDAARTELFWMHAQERATLEQAAQICDVLATYFPATNVGFDVGYTMAARRAAEDIRNLQEQP